MYILFSISNKQEINKAFGKKMKSLVDIYDYYVVTDVKSILGAIRSKGESPYRIIFTQDFFTDIDLELNKLRNELLNHQSTEVIFLSNGSVQAQNKGNIFNSIMRSPNYTVLFFKDGQIDVKGMKNLISASIGELGSLYGTGKQASVLKGKAKNTVLGRKGSGKTVTGQAPEDDYEPEDDGLSMENINSYTEDDYDDSEYDDGDNQDNPDNRVGYNNANAYMQPEQPSDFEKKVFCEPRDRLILFVGDDASDAYVYATDMAGILQNTGSKVLVLDLDDKDNFILSRFNIEDFYDKTCQGGIENQKIYGEDGIDLLSNGYGVPVTTESLRRLLDMGIFERYDYVIAHCPIDRLEIVPLKLVNMSDIRCFIKAERNHILKAVRCVTDRRCVSAIMEDALYSRSHVFLLHPEGYTGNDDAQSIYAEDIEFIKNYVVFTRQNWAGVTSVLYI